MSFNKTEDDSCLHSRYLSFSVLASPARSDAKANKENIGDTLTRVASFISRCKPFIDRAFIIASRISSAVKQLFTSIAWMQASTGTNTCSSTFIKGGNNEVE